MQKKSNLIHNRKSTRLHGYDYTQPGVYFVTICTYRFAHLFGHISDGIMRQNDLGRLVEQEWRNTATIRPMVELDLFVVMPNHFHGLVCITDVEDVLRRAESRTIQSNSLGAIIAQFKSTVTKRSSGLAIPPRRPIWKRNYHDRIVRNQQELEKIQRYILANPARWHEDRFCQS